MSQESLAMQLGTTASEANDELKAAYGDAYAVLSDDSKRTAYDKERITSSVCATSSNQIPIHMHLSHLASPISLPPRLTIRKAPALQS